MRILYLHGSVVPPPTDLWRNRFQWLSERLGGDVHQLMARAVFSEQIYVHGFARMVTETVGGLVQGTGEEPDRPPVAKPREAEGAAR